MSLQQKYTWHDFLKAHPEHREKKTKRTSSEGKKAFAAAAKAYLKQYLAEKQKAYDKQIEKATVRRDALTTKAKTLRSSKKWNKAEMAQSKIGQKDAAIAQLQKQQQRATKAQKSL